MPDADGPQKPEMRALGEGWALALIFPLSIVGGFLLGYGADKLLPIGSWGKIVGTALGITAAFVHLFRIGLRNDGTGT